MFCPTHFCASVKVVLRKPGKSDYTVAKKYRPIVFLNTLGKSLKFILAKKILYMTKIYGIQSQKHFGVRRARSTEHAIHYVVERIYNSRNKKKIASELLLDVMGAYDNLSKERLLHNLRSKQIYTRIVMWIDSFLTGRFTIFRTNEHTTKKINIFKKIPQGSPLSPILFLFYNWPLLEELEKEKDVSAAGFVDVIAVLVERKSCEGNSTVLFNLHEKICKLWAHRHGSKFAPKKY